MPNPGRFRPPDQPDPRALGLTWPPLLTAYDALAALIAELRLHSTRRAALDDDRKRAVSGDRARAAKALRDGKPIPDAAATAKIDAEIAGTERRIDALRLAITDADDDLGRVITEHRARWLAETAERETAERHEYAAAVETLAARRAAMLTSIAVARWLDAYPDRFRPTADHLHGIDTANGEPMPAALVLDALRADAIAAVEVGR